MGQIVSHPTRIWVLSGDYVWTKGTVISRGRGGWNVTLDEGGETVSTSFLEYYRVVCAYCRQLPEVHVAGKCLFEPTNYEEEGFEAARVRIDESSIPEIPMWSRSSGRTFQRDAWSITTTYLKRAIASPRPLTTRSSKEP